MKSPKFIVFEGINGCGKSTQLSLLKAKFEAAGIPHIATREPGGTELGEQLRTILKTTHGLDNVTVALMMIAARNEHVLKVIVPALEAGKWVLCDRFEQSTFAYQGSDMSLHDPVLDIAVATRSHWPDRLYDDMIEVHFDIDPSLAKSRLSARVKNSSTPVPFEEVSDQEYKKITDYYRFCMDHSGDIILDADQPVEGVHEDLMLSLKKMKLKGLSAIFAEHSDI